MSWERLIKGGRRKHDFVIRLRKEWSKQYGKATFTRYPGPDGSYNLLTISVPGVVSRREIEARVAAVNNTLKSQYKIDVQGVKQYMGTGGYTTTAKLTVMEDKGNK